MNSILADKLLKKQRKSIDRLDSILVFTLAERFKLTEEVGEIKAKNNLPPSDPIREKHHLEKLQELAILADLDTEFAKKFISFIFTEVIQGYKNDLNNTRKENN